jgi:DNA-binding transcriptional LysR family regulator
MLNLVHLKVLAAVARQESVTEAARELHYSQPSISHHLSRLEAATGVKLVQRVGRGIRLTPEGELLANRAAEIIGRVDAATTELAAQIGLQTGRVRLAANASVLSTIVAKAAPMVSDAHPGLELTLFDRHPVPALEMLRRGEIDVALIFRYPDAPVEEEGFRLVHIGDDPIYLTALRTIATPPGSAVVSGVRRSWSPCAGKTAASPRGSDHSATTWSSYKPSSPPAEASPPCPAWPSRPTAAPTSTPPKSPTTTEKSTPPPTANPPTHQAQSQ